ncbi:MAG TPA: tRNA pseudouridine(55) synthase TruB [Pyrinomonadaceae bacterium]|nr:tRNA pseudouridine(55) synthase TruB [Pyrinomonadaceae bacterium]
MDGILIIDKPAGWTSHDVVARVRRVLRERRVGHTGTLDPFATGVLVVLVGRATRLAQFLSGAEKEYEAVVRFGYATDTGDLTGVRRRGADESEGACADGAAEGPAGSTADTHDVSNPSDASNPSDGSNLSPTAVDCSTWDEARFEAALKSLRGETEQVPPMYSAKKVGGKKLYELARRGEEVERKAVRVFVREFEVVRREGGLARSNADGTCDVDARVVCSAGTYVRALAESLGERMGAGAHLAALRRTRAGAFRIAEALTLEELNAAAEGVGAARKLLPPDAALPEMPAVHLTAEEARRARQGNWVRVPSELSRTLGDGAHVRLVGEPEGLLAVGVYDGARRQARPRVLLVAEARGGQEE